MKKIFFVFMLNLMTVSFAYANTPNINMDWNTYDSEKDAATWSNVDTIKYVMGWSSDINGRQPIFDVAKTGYEAKIWIDNGDVHVKWKHYQANIQKKTQSNDSDVFFNSQHEAEGVFQADHRKTVGIPDENGNIFLTVGSVL